eukprot:TRINITY_DN1085_c0_g1_i1.p1 TRINITY_DN1085_c0_g1~~TRINITY_DN1085_c0_g1_i1.p1  ORF type:complete len:949 (+),score=258.41 TRINITY_DN1085_c0_g1_i1:159-2849(+)
MQMEPATTDIAQHNEELVNDAQNDINISQSCDNNNNAEPNADAIIQNPDAVPETIPVLKDLESLTIEDSDQRLPPAKRPYPHERVPMSMSVGLGCEALSLSLSQSDPHAVSDGVSSPTLCPAACGEYRHGLDTPSSLIAAAFAAAAVAAAMNTTSAQNTTLANIIRNTSNTSNTSTPAQALDTPSTLLSSSQRAIMLAQRSSGSGAAKGAMITAVNSTERTAATPMKALANTNFATPAMPFTATAPSKITPKADTEMYSSISTPMKSKNESFFDDGSLNSSDGAQSVPQKTRQNECGIPSKLNRKIKSLLNSMRQRPDGIYFNEPVDPIALGIPQYPSIIKHPMDFGTIMSRLERGKYPDLPHFISAVHLVFSNATTFNPEGNVVNTAAKTLQRYFDSEMRMILSEFTKDVDSPLSIPATPTPKVANSEISVLRQQVTDIKKQIDKMKESPAPPRIATPLVQVSTRTPTPGPSPASLRTSSSSSQQSARKDQRNRTPAVRNPTPSSSQRSHAPSSVARSKTPSNNSNFSDEERAEKLKWLNESLLNLPESKLVDVYTIILDKYPQCRSDSGVEFDINILDGATLRALERCVKGTKISRGEREGDANSATMGSVTDGSIAQNVTAIDDPMNNSTGDNSSTLNEPSIITANPKKLRRNDGNSDFEEQSGESDEDDLNGGPLLPPSMSSSHTVSSSTSIGASSGPLVPPASVLSASDSSAAALPQIIESHGSKKEVFLSEDVRTGWDAIASFDSVPGAEPELDGSLRDGEHGMGAAAGAGSLTSTPPSAFQNSFAAQPLASPNEIPSGSAALDSLDTIDTFHRFQSQDAKKKQREQEREAAAQIAREAEEAKRRAEVNQLKEEQDRAAFIESEKIRKQREAERAERMNQIENVDENDLL